MADPARYSNHIDTDWDVMPRERAGPPLASFRHTLVRRLLLALGGLGLAGVLIQDPSRASGWWSAITATMMPAVNRLTEKQAAQPEPALPPLASRVDAEPPPTQAASLEAPAQPLPQATASSAPSAALTKPAQPPQIAAVQPQMSTTDQSATALPPVKAIDPWQKRAEAVGLHPHISRVLLEGLSEADYRNAGAAIRTALAETADDAVLVWPRQRKPELALFHVRFVAGAAPDCRRYVVTIAKDGWTTTALPMERCGIKNALQRAESRQLRKGG